MNKDLFNNQKESAGANDNSLGLEEIKMEVKRKPTLSNVSLLIQPGEVI